MVKQQKTIPFTPQKYKQMQDEVAALEKQQEEVIARLQTAREMGDLSENGAYKYAKFELGNVRRKLGQLKRLLAHGFPASKQTTKKDIVEFGSEVVIEKQTTGKQRTIMIVSKHESDPLVGKIAYSSPMGTALMRKTIGDVVSVETPAGVQKYTIISVS